MVQAKKKLKSGETFNNVVNEKQSAWLAMTGLFNLCQTPVALCDKPTQCVVDKLWEINRIGMKSGILPPERKVWEGFAKWKEMSDAWVNLQNSLKRKEEDKFRQYLQQVLFLVSSSYPKFVKRRRG